MMIRLLNDFLILFLIYLLSLLCSYHCDRMCSVDRQNHRRHCRCDLLQCRHHDRLQCHHWYHFRFRCCCPFCHPTSVDGYCYRARRCRQKREEEWKNRKEMCLISESPWYVD
uniref:Putative secreted peptide n=1 Tax=Anopheles braziliensis TaxID=58242 RepID=A0A2M3ZVI4_9DIPT